MTGKGNANTHRKNRERLRRKLRARGLPEAEIERLVAEKAQQQAAVRDATGTRNRARNHATRRQELRRRLEAEGHSPAAIDRAVERLRAQQEAARRADVDLGNLDAIHDETWRQPDDAAYRPRPPDPLERGAARVTTRTAQAARRRKATTRYELNQQEAPRG